MPNPFKTKKRRRKYHLTQAGRTALQTTAKKNNPSQHSTGPRTFAGKTNSRNNAYKHAYYSKRYLFKEAPAYRALVRSLNRQSNPKQTQPIGPPITED